MWWLYLLEPAQDKILLLFLILYVINIKILCKPFSSFLMSLSVKSE